uniref:Uncharacterized protein n=1 Tax=Acrobeloides nanus TaxID=290746 RepID=A0A914CA15_9BILA
MSLWNRQVQVITQRFTQRMANLFSYPEGVSMEPFPPMPTVPCFCSSCVAYGTIGPIDSKDNIDADSDTDIESK